jgi:hypothetical protein
MLCFRNFVNAKLIIGPKTRSKSLAAIGKKLSNKFWIAQFCAQRATDAGSMPTNTGWSVKLAPFPAELNLG